MSFARPSAGSGRRVRYPKPTRSFTNSETAARLSCARSASSVSRFHHPDVAEDLEVRLPDIAVSGIRTWRGEVVTKLSQQPDQKLPDRQAVGRRIS